MSLIEKMWKYEHITGESAEHAPIIKLGAFLNGYEMGLKALEQRSRDCKTCIHSDNGNCAGTEECHECMWDSKYEQQSRWIPVSERLPEDFEDVLVWYEYFRYGNYNRMFETYGIGCYISNTGTWSGDPGTGTKAKVIAWMPLPKPYKEGEQMTNEEAKRNLVYAKRWKDIPDEEALDMAINALDIELLTDKEQRIFLKAMSREREVCQKVDDDFTDDDMKVSLVKICNEIERKVKKIWES